MKKSTVVLAVMVLTAFFASSAFSGDMFIGVKGGLNLARVWGDAVPGSAEMKMGAIAGAFFCYGLYEFFAVQPEVYYAMKGYKEEKGDDFYTAKLNYIDVVLLGKLLIPMEGTVHPYFFAGPYIGLNISGDYEQEIGGEAGEGEIEYVKSADYGAVLGGGANIDMGETGKIIIDARYNLGFATLYDVEDDPDLKNDVITVMVGYSYAF